MFMNPDIDLAMADKNELADVSLSLLRPFLF